MLGKEEELQEIIQAELTKRVHDDVFFNKNIDKRSTLLNHMSGVMDLFVECDACTQNMIKTHYEIEDMYELGNYTDAKYRHKYLLEDIIQMTKDIDGGEGDLEIVGVWLQEIIDKMDEFGSTREIGVVM